MEIYKQFLKILSAIQVEDEHRYKGSNVLVSKLSTWHVSAILPRVSFYTVENTGNLFQLCYLLETPKWECSAAVVQMDIQGKMAPM